MYLSKSDKRYYLDGQKCKKEMVDLGISTKKSAHILSITFYRILFLINFKKRGISQINCNFFFYVPRLLPKYDLISMILFMFNASALQDLRSYSTCLDW